MKQKGVDGDLVAKGFFKFDKETGEYDIGAVGAKVF